MLKKRVIFVLYFNYGFFSLSRNFKLQNCGDINWLLKNYNFSKITKSIDELIILNVSLDKRSTNKEFVSILKKISQECFIPISAGGGVYDLETAKKYLKSGADKIVLNTILTKNQSLVKKLANLYGKQCLVASVDFKIGEKKNKYEVYIESGNKLIDYDLKQYLKNISRLPVGEIIMNSIDRDGTGQGYFFKALNCIDFKLNLPIIYCGGAGNWKHFYQGLKMTKINAVATANLFNFINDGLINARNMLLKKNIDLPVWK